MSYKFRHGLNGETWEKVLTNIPTPLYNESTIQEVNNMADQHQLDVLRQGWGVWNPWREQHPEIQPDLSDADLSFTNLYRADLGRANLSGAGLINANLSGADLSGANLIRANLSRADLSDANLSDATLINATLINANLIRANLIRANLSGANLSRTNLSYANLIRANLIRANLSGATLLSRADLSRANLSGADLSGADLSYANLSGADLSLTDLSRARVGWTHFDAIDLRTVRGLETVEHRGPSSIGIDAIYLSRGDIPEAFLRKAGVPEDFLTYMRSLVNRPIEYYTCFISYSSRDQEFADQLYADLQSKGVRCWFAPEDRKTGYKIRQRIDESIHRYDKLLLVLSEHSIASSWVEFEVEAALAKENEKHALVLFPVRLDNSVMQSTTSWAAHLKRMRHITDFTGWEQHDNYQKALTRLLRDLKAETPPEGSTT